MPRLRILFFLLAANFDRVFGSFLEELLERGHEVRVVVEKRKPNLLPGGGALLDSLAARYPSFSYGYEPPRDDEWLRARTACRHGLDYLRYLEPAFEDASDLRARAGERAPVAVLRLDRLLIGSPQARRLTTALLRRLEAALPIDGAIRAQLAAAERGRRAGLPARRPRVEAERLGSRRARARDPVRAAGRELGQPDEQGRPEGRADAHRRLERGPGRRGRRPPRRSAGPSSSQRCARLRPLVRPSLRPLA